MKQEAFFRRFKLNRACVAVENQQGQAVVEYILMLVVVVTLVLGLRGVFSSMNNYMSNIMGDYVSCLMEFGELPSLGIQDTDLKKHLTGGGTKQCQAPTFSAAVVFGNGTNGTGGGTTGSGSTGGPRNGNGKNDNGNGSSSGKGNGSQNSANNSGNSGKSSDASSGSSSGSNSDSSSGSSSASNSSRRGSPYTRGQVSRSAGASTADNFQAPGSGDAKVKAIDGKGDKGEGGGSGSGDGGGRRSRNVGYDRGRYKAITGDMALEIEKQTRLSPRKPGSTSLIAKDEGYRLTALKRNIAPPEIKEKVEEKKTEEFSLGNFFKWIVIAGIIIACFILFGGQVLNYSNSDS